MRPADSCVPEDLLASIQEQSFELTLQLIKLTQCLSMDNRILCQVLEKIEWLSHSESWGQDDLFGHSLIAKEAEVFLLQAAAQV